MRKDQIRARAEAQLARYPKNSGHARVLRAKLGITDAAPAPAPAPVVEDVPDLSTPVDSTDDALPSLSFMATICMLGVAVLHRRKVEE